MSLSKGSRRKFRAGLSTTSKRCSRTSLPTWQGNSLRCSKKTIKESAEIGWPWRLLKSKSCGRSARNVVKSSTQDSKLSSLSLQWRLIFRIHTVQLRWARTIRFTLGFKENSLFQIQNRRGCWVSRIWTSSKTILITCARTHSTTPKEGRLLPIQEFRPGSWLSLSSSPMKKYSGY